MTGTDDGTADDSTPLGEAAGDGAGGAGGDATPRHRHHRWRIALAIVGGVVVVGVGFLVVSFVFRENPGAKDVGRAVQQFRSSSTSTPASDQPTLRPPAGVYLLAGEGHEEISFPPVSQKDGATMPMTVTHEAAGCWTLKLDYNAAHWQDFLLCPDENGLYEHDGHTFQSWDFGSTKISNLSSFECDPPNPKLIVDAEKGTTSNRRCVGTNERVAGTTVTEGTLTFLGRETLTIGGKQVEALHFREENEVTGSQEGDDSNDWWWSAENALPLKATRSVKVDSPTPIGAITYTEEGSWELTSTTPKT